MRIMMLAAAVALFGTACYTESAPSRYYVASDRVDPEEFDDYTVNGDFVRVARDRGTGDLIIVSPSELHGARVALISDTGANGSPLVTTDVRPVRRVIIHEGSGGDRR